MRRLLLFLFILPITISCFSTIYEGQWQIDNITYTFDNDTLYVDELGNEGDMYIITEITDNKIVAKNIFTEDFIINVIEHTDSYMIINIEGDINFKLTKNKKRVDFFTVNPI